MEQKANKMGVMPVGKLTLTMGLPLILSMILQALYNIVDSYFVCRIPGQGDVAMNALTLAFPVQMLMIAVGVGTGVGVNALLSRSLGEGDKKNASLIAGNARFLGVCVYVVFLLFGLFGIDLYFRSQTSDEEVIAVGTNYLRICSVLSFGSVLYMIIEKLLQGTGKTIAATIALVAGAAANIVLDPIMIFGYLGCPALGVDGAAWATVIGQWVSLIVGMAFHYFSNKEIDGSPRYLLPKKKIISEIYRVGIPAIVMQALMSFMTYGVNLVLYLHSADAVTAYGIYYKIQQFALFAAFGLNNAQIPIVGYNYGMRDPVRLKQAMLYGFIDTVVVMAVCMIGFEIFATPLAGIFRTNEDTEILCVQALRVISFGYLFIGANVSFQGIFQALGRGMMSLILSFLRLIGFDLPLLFLFVKTGAGAFMWAAFPIAEGLSFLIGCFMMKRAYTRAISELC